MIQSLYEVEAQELANLLIDDAKIMMIDDEQLNMDVLEIHLGAEGYKNFVAVSDSTTAMDRLREELPDVLLLDLVMPEVTGFDILRLIREDEKLRYLPVIVLTSANDPETKLEALTLGATDFLAKPIDASELALRLKNTLSAIAWQKRMSEVDPLSNLPNRAWFRSMLEGRLEKGVKNRMLSALVLINIDRFKSINDSLGAEQGDVALKEFSQRLINCLRDGEAQPWFSKQQFDNTKPIIARLDGDRFAVVMPWTDGKQIEAILESVNLTLAKALDEPIMVAEQAIYLSVSIGVSIVGSANDTVESLINNAETALRHSRRRTDSSFAIYSDHMDAKARELLSIENGLRTAVEKEEIFVVYQPKVDVVSNRIAGAEALVRWLHPEMGLVSPANFIGLAEDSGMIVSIGQWVLRESCRQAKIWQNSGHEDFKIAVNVSIRQLYEPDFLDTVSCALEDSNLPVISLAHDLGMNVVAEGVETQDQLFHIRALNCEEYQGFYFSRPIPADEFHTLLQERQLKIA